MNEIIIMAWRNIWRNKRRSLVVIAAVALGIIAMILSMGFMNALGGQMIDNTINTSLGHVAVHRSGFQDAMKLEKSFIPSQRIVSAVQNAPDLVSWAPRVKVQGIARSSETSRGILLVGIDPEREKTTTQLFDYTDKTAESSWLTSRSANDILISRNLAKKLQLLPGDRIVIMVQDMNRDITGFALTVRGLYQSPVESFDRYMVFAGIEKVQQMTGLGKSVSEISCVLAHREKAPAAKRHILSSVSDPSLEVLSWMDMVPSLVSMVALYDTMMYIFFAVVFVTVIFSVANTLIMAVMERFHEIGVMKSIGTRPSWIFSLIICESVSLCLAGLAAGLAGGLLFLWALSFHGLDLSLFSDAMRQWGAGSILYPYVKAADIAASVVIVMITAILAALYPAVKAARIRPLDAVNYL